MSLETSKGHNDSGLSRNGHNRGPTRAEKLQSIVWLPFVYQEEQMTAYRLVRTPTRLHGDYVELSPEQERILLVSHRNEGGLLPWTMMTTAKWSACRPAGKIYTPVRTFGRCIPRFRQSCSCCSKFSTSFLSKRKWETGALPKWMS